MLRSINEIMSYTIMDTNNELVGQVHDFYFDDLTWTVRYLVVDVGVWLPGRRVLISTARIDQPDVGGSVSLPVHLTKQQIENSPTIDVDKPVSRQQEIELAEYYRWPRYWDDVTFIDARAAGMNPAAYVRSGQEVASVPSQAPQEVKQKTTAAEQQGDPHLRSVKEVTGYYIEARDGDIGHVEDFIVEDKSWIMHYLVIDTKNWWPGKKVLVAPTWIEIIDWGRTKVHIDLKRETIKNSPEYDPSMPVNREYETRLYDFYGRPKYWS